MDYKIAGVSSLILNFGNIISDESSAEVLALYRRLIHSEIDGLIEIIPSYTTLYIEFDIFAHTHESLYALLVEMANMEHDSSIVSYREVNIPTYYDEEVGLDLHRVASEHGLSVPQVIEIHSQKVYTVYTIGFTAGFAYMGSVDERIATPRLATPRLKIPKGSIAIANSQCAVYPLDSPGGWNILGRTHISMFDRDIDGFSYLRVGDRVRFSAISRDEFLSAGGHI